MTRTRDPVLFLLIGLLLLLVPVAIGLVYLYEKAQWRHANSDLPPVPSLEGLSKVVRAFNPELTDPQLKMAYQVSPQPRSGLLVLYEVSDREWLIYRLAVIRHDIACATCRDLLVGVFLDPDDAQIQGVVSLEPWELKEGLMDPAAFLSQLKGHSVLDSLTVGRDIDGITGASYSVEALLVELKGVGKWITRGLL